MFTDYQKADKGFVYQTIFIDFFPFLFIRSSDIICLLGVLTENLSNFIFGLIILVFCLSSGLAKEEYLERPSGENIDHFVLFFCVCFSLHLKSDRSDVQSTL